MTFSDKVKRSRELAELTQQQLADAVGVSRRTIVSYETTDARARASTVRKLAKALHVSYDFLTYDDVIDPLQGMEKMEHLDTVREQFGNSAAQEMDELLERNAALFAGGELSEEAKDTFYTAVTKAYLLCKDEARKTYGRKKRAPQD